ncbi:DUF1304 domain-containing protein [Paraoerskovia marina]|uniref:DUF1304 domain-containing protein n=1 Tax=Paraoerskovia marina TaxID=545619 RepID=UPI00049293DE|nr:DUF1304 domain-containing protein [Paraoerskovia marina]
MLVAALILAALAALVHVYIFVLETFRWEDERTRATFGTTAEEAATTRSLAYNQGFYNLFLAIATFVGIAVTPASHEVGFTLIVVGTGSMLAAATVLLLSDRSKIRPAIIQGMFPLTSLLCLAIYALPA